MLTILAAILDGVFRADPDHSFDLSWWFLFFILFPSVNSNLLLFQNLRKFFVVVIHVYSLGKVVKRKDGHSLSHCSMKILNCLLTLHENKVLLSLNR